MTIDLPESVLRTAGFDEREARIEFACWLYDRGKIHLWPAAQLAGLSRSEFETELMTRGLAVIRYDEENWALEATANAATTE